ELTGLALIANDGNQPLIVVTPANARGGADCRRLEPRRFQTWISRPNVSAVVRRVVGVNAGERGDPQVLTQLGPLDDVAQTLFGARVVAPPECFDGGALQLFVAGRARHLLDGGDGLITGHRRQESQCLGTYADVG